MQYGSPLSCTPPHRYLRPDVDKKSKHKTCVKKKTLNPEFHEVNEAGKGRWLWAGGGLRGEPQQKARLASPGVFL